jgi:hypothetical protein
MLCIHWRALWPSHAAPRCPPTGECYTGRPSPSANHFGVSRGFVSAYSQNEVAGTTQMGARTSEIGLCC